MKAEVSGLKSGVSYDALQMEVTKLISIVQQVYEEITVLKKTVAA